MINYHLSKKKFNDLNPLERLYLFFVNYFVNKESDYLPNEYSIKRIDELLNELEKKLSEYKEEYGDSHKKTKDVMKQIRKNTKKKMN